MIKWTVVDTPAGPFCVVADENDVVRASGWESDVDDLLREVAPELARMERTEEDLGRIREAVVDYYERGDFAALDGIEVHPAGTAFLGEAWAAMRAIPAGERVTYQQLADRMGRPTATRAAASACARNRTGLFVPCHRVVRSDGSTGQFRWGPDTKRWHLDHERVGADSSA
ncbi:methylated-DNA--[protein]-cysteine S-methyltransferase [Saccharopolyspora halophila]|uniref:Methylated-DNA--[protein]-cysteine S-methyltransferase n=1 Tax=Saccharopolyspora halophila TaxID=405551 RepID=A0ABN3FK64_9PSEU